MTYGINKGNTMPAGRRAFTDNSPVHSKATKDYGSQGSKSDFPASSTGENPAKIRPDDIAPSAPSRSHTDRAVVQSRTSGWDPATGKWLGASHPNSGRHDGGHEEARKATTDGASGMAHSASGGRFGKPTQRPSAKNNTGTKTSNPAVLDGSPTANTAYQGGKGSVR